MTIAVAVLQDNKTMSTNAVATVTVKYMLIQVITNYLISVLMEAREIETYLHVHSLREP